jgi:hypothetical protein
LGRRRPPDRDRAYGILDPPPIERERQRAERVAYLENRLLDAEEANKRPESLIAKSRAKTARLEKMLLDRAG